MQSKMRTAQRAVDRFFSMIHEDDEIFLMTFATRGRNMDAVLDTIAAELRSQYSIGYYPNRPAKDGRWHSVRIRMKTPGYFARARREYLDK